MGSKERQGSRGASEMLRGVVMQAEAIASNTDPVQHLSGNDSRDNATTSGSANGLSEPAIEHAPPPPYSEDYGTVDFNQDGLNTRANVADDGRINISIDQKSRKLSNLLAPALRNQLNIQQIEEPSDLPPAYVPPFLGGTSGGLSPPQMNVVIQVVGSRGDVQPFVALGKVLQKTYSHRVRLATHPIFRGFVEENGLEFFSIGGDPAELMAFMVKNPGLMPGKDALRKGDIGRRRKGMYDIIRGCWRSCYETGDGKGIAVSDHQSPEAFDTSAKPFVADAIIANPPSFAHIHCAEKLGIPLHLMFTMPWSPTQSFPHPLANIQSSNADTSMTNYISYALVEMMTWQGLGDIINRFREKSLGLEPISLIAAPGIATRLRIPYTYCWSPALIPKPRDWGTHISIAGFYFLSLAANYEPERELLEFLEAGPPPIYIGFGSIVVDDPNAMTKLIFKAVEESGQRALVSKGWGGLGTDALGKASNVFMLGNVPHDWLFKHVSCVVHHGGAGTTAAGIALGKPTVIVPFFGDQPFWGAMIAKAGAGPQPIPNNTLTPENLASAIKEALKPSTLERAKELGARIASEEGSEAGAKAFHSTLDFEALRCSLSPSRIAVWRVKKTDIILSGFAATTLGNEGLLAFSDLKLLRSKEYNTDEGPWEPITGAASALIGTIGSLMMGAADVPTEIFKGGIHKASRPSRDAGSSVSTTSQGVDGTMPSNDGTELRTRTMEPKPLENHRQDRDKLTFSAETDTGVMINRGSSTSNDAFPRSKSPGNSDKESHETKIPLSADSTLDQNRITSGITLESAIGAGKGIGRIVDAGLKSPMDFTLSLAKGFHNAPKLYGDSSVRPHDRITGFQSGLRAAGKEFGYGFYDGISGLVTHPLEGAKKEGLAGFLKGFGKGIGGVVLKPGAGIWGLPGYTFKGIYKELQKRLGSSVQNYIIAARTAQGYEDWNTSSEAERLDIVSRWHAAQVELLKRKKQLRSRMSHFSEDIQIPSSTTIQEREHHEIQGSGEVPMRHSDGNATGFPGTWDSDDEDAVFEQAIRDSVIATSTGNPEEDSLIERAIRASVTELRYVSEEGDKDDGLHKAIQASIVEANKARAEATQDHSKSAHHINRDDEQLEAAIRFSLENHDNPIIQSHDHDDSRIESEDDENIKYAIRDSRNIDNSTPEDQDLAKALAESAKEYQRHESAIEQSKREEEIVLNYVAEQSHVETNMNN